MVGLDFLMDSEEDLGEVSGSSVFLLGSHSFLASHTYHQHQCSVNAGKSDLSLNNVLCDWESRSSLMPSL